MPQPTRYDLPMDAEFYFRHKNGHIVPAGRRSVSIQPSGRLATPRVDEDYWYPTKCPECGTRVFFLRHNGGCVWLDEVHPPWPKHACMYSNVRVLDPAAELLTWLRSESAQNAKQYGVVQRARAPVAGHTSVAVAWNTGTGSCFRVECSGPTRIDVGLIVCLRQSDGHALLEDMRGRTFRILSDTVNPESLGISDRKLFLNSGRLTTGH